MEGINAMDREIAWAAVAAVLALAMVAGGWRWGWVRGALGVLCAVVGTVSALVTVFFLYAGFAWPASGTLLFFTLPAGVLAWVAFALLRVFWNLPPPVENQP
jgi:hypothetical protein